MFRTSSALWLWPSEVGCSPNQYVQFRHEFILPEPIDCAEMAVSCDSNYALWVNGEFVDYDQYHDFPDYKTYDILNVRNLKQGKNALAFIVYYQGEDSSQYIRGVPGLIYTLKTNSVNISSGKDTCYRIDQNYKSGEIDKITVQLGYTFEYDAIGTDNWRDLDYTPGDDWNAPTDNDVLTLEDRPINEIRPINKLVFRGRVETRIAAQGVFMRRPVGELTPAETMQTDYLSTREQYQILEMLEGGLAQLKHNAVGDADGLYLVLDLGREEAGLFDLDIETAEGTVIDISWGEQLEDLRVRAYVGGRHFACKYICKEGRQNFIHYFKRLGGRYLQLHFSNMSGDVMIHYAGILRVEYPLERKGSFICSDSLHNKIYETCTRTLHLCMHEHYEDTPWREQALYAMDMRNQALAGYYCFGEYDFPAASLTLLARSLNDDGFFELCAPARIQITIPVFSLAWVLAVSDHYRYSGNIDTMRSWFQTVKTILDKRMESMSDGLLPVPCGERYWQFYDWAHEIDGSLKVLSGNRYDAPLNLFYILALDAASALAEELEDDAAKGSYRSIASDLKFRFHEKFWDANDGSYQTYIGDGAWMHHCELTQALAILAGVCPECSAAALRERLANQDNGLVKTTLSYTFYKFEALLTDPATCGKNVFDEILRDWGYMLFNGATSFWETIKGSADFGNAGSLCHGWSGIPAYFYHAYILGIKPTAPGFKKYEHAPLAQVVDRASGTVPTPHGPIEISKSS